MRFLPQVLAVASLLGLSSAVPNIECFNQLPSGQIKSLGSGKGEFSVGLYHYQNLSNPYTSFVPGSGDQVTVLISSNNRNIQYFAISAVPDVYPEFENYGNRRNGIFNSDAFAPINCQNADITEGNALISNKVLDAPSYQVTWNVPAHATFSLLFYTTIMTSDTEAYTLETFLRRDASCTSAAAVAWGDEAPASAECDSADFSITTGVQYWGINIGKGIGAPAADGGNTPDTPADPLSHKYALKSHYGDNETSYEQPSVPGSAFLDYFLKSNPIDVTFNTVRFPISWNEIQPALQRPLNATWVANLQALASTLEKNYNNATLVLDLHSFGHYTVNGVSYPITMGSTGSAPVTSDDFKFVWQLIGTAFLGRSNVIFGLQNQPHNLLGDVTTQASEAWSNIAKAGIAGIRASGNLNLILLSGTGWSRLKDWWGTYTKDMEYGTANSEVMFNAVDEVANNLAYDINLFFDEDGNGNSDICYSVDTKPLFANFAIWLTNNGKRAFLSAIGTSNGTNCEVALKISLRAVVQNPGNATHAGFIGWAYYMAGEESLGNSFSIQPPNNDYTLVDQKFSWLKPFMYANPSAQTGTWNDLYTYIGMVDSAKTPSDDPASTSSSMLVSADRSVLIATLFAALAITKFF